MTDNVVRLPVVTTLDTPTDVILDGAKAHGLQDCVVVGWDKDGKFYFASSVADGGDVLWLFEHAKKQLFSP